MRAACLLLLVSVVLLTPLGALAQDAKRYNVAPDTKSYPQSTPKEALTSVLKAIDDDKFSYLVAHLADPKFVDDRVTRVYAGKFSEQVADTKARLDAATVKQLRKFLKDGKWDLQKTTAVVELEDVKDRVVRLVKRDGRWYLSHRYDPPAKE